MLLLNIRIALRNFLRNRLFSFINIFGLALGLAAGLFVILMIYFETSFDNFHPDSDRLYRLTEHFKTPSKEISSGICWEPIAAAAAEEIPGISSFCRVGRFNERTIKYQQKKIKVDNLLSADSVFFNIFGFKLLEGNPKQVLKAPYQIVLTSSLARKIYGNMKVIGKTLLINENEYTITGIAADPPQNSHLQFDAIFSHSTLKHDPSVHLSWDGGQNFLSYIKLARNTKPETVESDFDDFLYTHVNRKFEKS